MAVTIEIDLKPLIASLRRLEFSWFLVSREFENIMLENNFDDIWLVAVRQVSLGGYIIKRTAYEHAFIEVCNLLWKKDKTFFFKFIQSTIEGLIRSGNIKGPGLLFTCLENLGMNLDDLNRVQKQNENKRKEIKDKSENKRSPDETGLVFIGHGRSPLWREVDEFLREEDIPFEVFESHSRTGEHVIDVLKKFLSKATFAIIVVTAEDKADEGKIRARQNVIHEIGLFQGKLGFENVAILKQNGVEGFSNNDGLQYIPFDGNDIKHTFYELGRTLKKVGLKK